MHATDTALMTPQEHIARIEYAQEDARRFRAETRETTLAPWQIAVTIMSAGAAIFGAGAAFMRLVGP